MAIVSAFCTSCKAELFNKEHDFNSDTIKMALYTSSAELGAATTAYTTTGEASGTGYTAGGATLAGASINTSGTTVYVDYDDPSWTTASFTAAGALIYNDTHASKAAIAVISFGGDFTVSSGTFTPNLPPSNASTAIIRLA